MKTPLKQSSNVRRERLYACIKRCITGACISFAYIFSDHICIALIGIQIIKFMDFLVSGHKSIIACKNIFWKFAKLFVLFWIKRSINQCCFCFWLVNEVFGARLMFRRNHCTVRCSVAGLSHFSLNAWLVEDILISVLTIIASYRINYARFKQESIFFKNCPRGSTDFFVVSFWWVFSLYFLGKILKILSSVQLLSSVS